MRLALRFPANAENASDHARLAVQVARKEFDLELDFSPHSLEDLDVQIESLRDDGLSGEDAAEALFVLGCYLGEVMVRHLRGQWVPTMRSPLRDLSPWPMVVQLPSGAAWDPIGKAYRRLELGDSEYLPAFFANASAPL
ncbi:MAG TPA: hypothetical protein VIZ31_02595, partial [Vicinamibacteria bacterium]